MKRFFIIGAIFGFGVAALIIPSLVGKQSLNETQVTADSEHEKYPLLAKRIFIGNPSDMIINFVSLRENLKLYISGLEDKTGLYFEYLPTGVHIGINDREEFNRASLVKVPLIIQLYKMIEDGFIKKDEKLTIRRDLLEENYGELGKAGAGTEKSVEELINLVLIDSDNTAYNVLLDRVNKVLYEVDPKNEKAIEKIYDYLDIPRDEKEKTLQISPRSYASILKALFFSSYLNYPESNEILEIMSRSRFTDWMPKKLPKDIKVAHKIGIYQGANPNRIVNSDCGIVYIPNRPFILCIMVNSGETEKMVPHISELTKMVYDYLASANGFNK